MASTTETEQVQISKYDNTQVKNAVDDELCRYFTAEKNYKQSHQHTDVKLLLGYASCFIAGGAVLYEYKTSFESAKQVTLACVIAFWLLQGLSLVYDYLYVKSEVFVGRNATSTLKISGTMERYSPNYELVFEYTDKSNKSAHHRVTKNVASWFKEDGTLVKERLDNDLNDALQAVTQQLHKE
ncbi:signal peptidase complex subunit 2 [Radiomyces spectabilis]|uniref:signal peptidase complex subunit 2 n=1 Tax=Radiomyces spectabilis TaxID=64574 RepID=UPI00221FE262|nr:signal peptidase complex subunit 2 [Radiomyces spectabilis]KAI8379180.1 signal peptidase complex subunit 2 [Radiomyces spectabilis]